MQTGVRKYVRLQLKKPLLILFWLENSFSYSLIAFRYFQPEVVVVNRFVLELGFTRKITCVSRTETRHYAALSPTGSALLRTDISLDFVANTSEIE